MSETTPKRWIGFSPTTVLIAVAVIVALNLIWAFLALTSTIHYIWAWTSGGGKVAVTRAYWDGRTEFENYPGTAWTLLAECGIWFVLAAAIVVSGYLAVRWLKRPSPARISPRRLSAWFVVAAVLFASAAALAAFLER